jgi:luciferase-like monooxygenase
MLPFAGSRLVATEPLVRRAEAAGWEDLWTGETNGPDGFTPLALATGWTQSMRLRTRVVGVFTPTSLCLMPICDPHELPAFIDGLAPG